MAKKAVATVKLKKGQHTTRTALGIKSQKSRVKTKDGQQYLFVTIRNEKKYQDELHYDGVVHEPQKKEDGGDSKDIVKYGEINKEFPGMRIMVRYNTGTEYEFIGTFWYMIRYDERRNKIFLEEEKGKKGNKTVPGNKKP